MSPSMTPSQARNAIKRALVELIDPSPSAREVERLWQHFRSACAFCGRALRRDKREAHSDHLIPSSQKGRNHICNRVLACAKCNGDEKLDLNWQAFLLIKSPQDHVERRQRILDWVESNRASCKVTDDDIQVAHVEAEKVLAAFNQACSRLRTSERSQPS